MRTMKKCVLKDSKTPRGKVRKMIQGSLILILFLIQIALANYSPAPPPQQTYPPQQYYSQPPQQPQQYGPPPQQPNPVPKKAYVDDDDSSDDDDPEYEDDWSSADRLSTKNLDSRRFYKLKFRKMYLRKLERVLKRIGQGVEVRKPPKGKLRCGKKGRKDKDELVEHHHYYYPSQIQTTPPPQPAPATVWPALPHPAETTTIVNVPKKKKMRTKKVIYYDDE